MLSGTVGGSTNDDEFKQGESRLSFLFSCCLIAILFLIECTFFLPESSPLRSLAGISWLVVSIVVLCSAWTYSALPFFTHHFWRNEDAVLYTLAYFLPIIVIFWDPAGITFTPINFEGTYQSIEATTLIYHDNACGIFSSMYCFYPSRQFLINSLPTVIVGPSLLHLRLGSGLAYVGAYLFFISGLRRYLISRDTTYAPLLTAHIGLGISLAGCGVMNAREFELRTTPITAMLMLLGGLLHYVERPSVFKILILLWSMGYCIYGYTPAEAVWVFIMTVIIYLIGWFRYYCLAPIILYSLLTLFISQIVRRHAQDPWGRSPFNVGIHDYNWVDWFWRYMFGLKCVGVTVWSLLSFPLFLGLIAACCLCWKYRDLRMLLVLGWSGAVFFASLTFSGSFFNYARQDIHRVMIVVPPIALMIALTFARYITEGSQEKTYLAAVRCLLYCCITNSIYLGVVNPLVHRSFYTTPGIDNEQEIFYDVQLLAQNSVHPPKVIYVGAVNPPLLQDNLHYLLPKLEIRDGLPPQGEKKMDYYVLTYISPHPETLSYDATFPNHCPRPWFNLKEE